MSLQAFPLPQGVIQYCDNNGKPLSNGQVFFYAAGTDTPKDTYNDFTSGVPNANPVILDNAGRALIAFGSGGYKQIVEDYLGNLIWEVDNLVAPGSGNSSTSTLSIVPTIAAARLLGDGVSDYVQVIGYYSASDGNGGLFQWVSGSSATENGGTVLEPSDTPATGRLIRVYNTPLTPKQFGAKGDNSTDDYTSFLNLITWITSNPGDIYIPGGTYIISNDLVIPANTTVFGDGAETILKKALPISWNGVSIFNLGSSDSNITIENLIIDLDGSNNSNITSPASKAGNISSGIIINNPSNITLRNLTIKGARRYIGGTPTNGYGIESLYVTNFLIDNCYISDCASGAGVYNYIYSGKVQNSSMVGNTLGSGAEINTGDMVFENCNFNSNLTGLLLDPNTHIDSNLIFSNCSVQNNLGNGVTITSNTTITIYFEKTYISSNANYGIFFTAASIQNVVVNNCSIILNGYDGIQCGAGTFNNSFTNNIICNNGYISLGENVWNGITFLTNGSAFTNNSQVNNNWFGNYAEYAVSPTQQYGVSIAVNTNYIQILNNNFQNNVLNSVLDNGTNNLLQLIDNSLMKNQTQLLEVYNNLAGNPVQIMVSNIATAANSSSVLALVTALDSDPSSGAYVLFTNSTTGGGTVNWSFGTASNGSALYLTNGSDTSSSRFLAFDTTGAMELLQKGISLDDTASYISYDTDFLFRRSSSSNRFYVESKTATAGNSFISFYNSNTSSTNMIEFDLVNQRIGITQGTDPAYDFEIIKSVSTGSVNINLVNSYVLSSATTETVNVRAGFGTYFAGNLGFYKIADYTSSGNQTAGLLLTLANGGSVINAFSVDNKYAYIYLPQNSLKVPIGGMITVDSTTVSNTSTSETDLHTYTLPGNTLYNGNESLEFYNCGIWDNTSTTNKFINIRYGGTLIWTSGSKYWGNGGQSNWSVRVKFARVSSSLVGYVEFLSSDSLWDNTQMLATFSGSYTYSGTTIIKTTGQGAASNEVTQTYSEIKWLPA